MAPLMANYIYPTSMKHKNDNQMVPNVREVPRLFFNKNGIIISGTLALIQNISVVSNDMYLYEKCVLLSKFNLKLVENVF